MSENFFEQLNTVNSKRQSEWNKSLHSDLAYDALEFVCEAGELGEQVKKYIRESKGLAGNRTSLEDIKDEIGDVMITLDKLINTFYQQTGELIDIRECTKEKFNKTSVKYGFSTMWNDLA